MIDKRNLLAALLLCASASDASAQDGFVCPYPSVREGFYCRCPDGSLAGLDSGCPSNPQPPWQPPPNFPSPEPRHDDFSIVNNRVMRALQLFAKLGRVGQVKVDPFYPGPLSDQVSKAASQPPPNSYARDALEQLRAMARASPSQQPDVPARKPDPLPISPSNPTPPVQIQPPARPPVHVDPPPRQSLPSPWFNCDQTFTPNGQNCTKPQ